ncbi:MAG: helix-turn-helix transcriptional regulator [Oscillospiraceae bacterium]|nr:helix-turn-helix transcriptional regulator [Oscillospiraceae bacterium]
MTQQDLANALGVSKSTISLYENGNREPDFEMMERIADHFNVNMSTFFSDGIVPSPSAVDPELTAYLEELRTRPEMRMLFSVAKDASKADIEKAVAIIEALRKTEGS